MKRSATSAAWVALITATVTVAVNLGVPRILATDDLSGTTPQADAAQPTEPFAAPVGSAPPHPTIPVARPDWGGDDKGWPSMHVVALDGTSGPDRVGLHTVYGDPCLDSRTLLTWDEGIAPGEAAAFRVLDAASGGATSLGIARLSDVSGVVAGALLVERTDWGGEPSPCPSTLCRTDVDTGEVAPWLTLPAGLRAGFVGAARGLAGGPAD